MNIFHYWRLLRLRREVVFLQIFVEERQANRVLLQSHRSDLESRAMRKCYAHKTNRIAVRTNPKSEPCLPSPMAHCLFQKYVRIQFEGIPQHCTSATISIVSSSVPFCCIHASLAPKRHKKSHPFWKILKVVCLERLTRAAGRRQAFTCSHNQIKQM